MKAIRPATNDALSDKPGVLEYGVDAVPAVAAGVDQPESRHAVGHPVELGNRVAFFLREKICSGRDDEAQIANARLVYPGGNITR